MISLENAILDLFFKFLYYTETDIKCLISR